MKLYPSLTPALSTWALQQPVFFIASAPLHGRHVNLSPKGMAGSTFAVLSPNQVAYLDRTGSGCETIAHIYENGRATIMFMSFGTNPRIMRLFCTGRVIEWDDREAFEECRARMGHARPDAARAVVVLDVFAVQTSCGYAVPRVRKDVWEALASGGGLQSLARANREDRDTNGTARAEDEKQDVGEGDSLKSNQFRNELCVFEDRPTLAERAAWRERNGKMLEYQIETNLDSLDGLPGLRVARREAGEVLWVGDVKARLRRMLAQREGIVAGAVLTLGLLLLASLLTHAAASTVVRRLLGLEVNAG